jgi:hypothetical protein
MYATPAQGMDGAWNVNPGWYGWMQGGLSETDRKAVSMCYGSDLDAWSANR